MLLYQIAITQIPGIGDVNAKKLIAYCGSAEAVFREKRESLLKIQGMGPATVNAIVGAQVLKRAEQEIKFIEKYGIQPLYYQKNDYPFRLKQCNDGPILLFYKGRANLNARYVLSIVGTRKISPYGRAVTQQLVGELQGMDILVVSGLAYGVDTVAHRCAVKEGLPTVGILAHGLDRIYPYANRKLAIGMQKNGGLLTEFMSETNPDRENFPRRNRIVAGLADATLVVESAKKGGALITAHIAASYNRDVFAVPGKVGDTYSEGCNYLIKANKAALVESADDIRYFMQWETDRQKQQQTRLFRELSREEQVVVEILKQHGSSGIDFLAMKSRLSHTRIAAVLLNLEFEGLVQNLPGKMFKTL